MASNINYYKKQMSEKLFFNIFRKKDLMSYAQTWESFINEDFPNKKAEAVGANLRKNCLINKGNLYVINPLNVFEKTDKMDAKDDKVKTMVSKFIQASCECFSEDQMDYIQK
jgi:hypothetical protein